MKKKFINLTIAELKKMYEEMIEDPEIDNIDQLIKTAGEEPAA